MQELFQSLIYTEQLLHQLYRRCASLSTMIDEREALLSFSKNSLKNSQDLNYFYHQMYGDYFKPMIPQMNIQGTYRAVLDEILRIEIESFLSCLKQTYRQDNFLFKETLREIADRKLGHTLSILAIIVDMNE